VIVADGTGRAFCEAANPKKKALQYVSENVVLKC
jgi:hypothetical protein